ncbi:NAD(P)/FAD-dependent oxidoreductase (plasmid) [Sphingobium sp. SJ10-10]|uniref:flavin-containing monooxygenase n=1 Tax=Sphingobium sp. SJ10-10 TaxID=3114999 RepID=UPI002E1724D2|nr:NAD(P)/FAD-dependent oxidoreductase [Sphingobium sp. SJ10-10]
MNNSELREALNYANVPTLLLLLFQITGDARWLEAPYLPTPMVGFTDHDTGGLSEKIQAEVREAALEAILAWKAGKPIAQPAPSAETLNHMLSVSTGESIPGVYSEMVEDTIRLASRVAGAKNPPERSDGFRAIIIGAGVSGLCAAIRLQDLGIPYTVLEKTGQVGGTWVANRYPGVGVDTPNHHYSFSFSNHDWTRYFCHGAELRDYLQQVARDFNVESQIEFNTEVSSLQWQDDAQQWEVQVRRAGSGEVETLRANVVISAVGIFSPAKMPAIKGLDAFKGVTAHTAEWPENLRLDGKDVVVVGSGASAMQLVPAIVDKVKSLTLIQRTPQWSAPMDEKFRGPIAEPLRRLFQDVPLYTTLYRMRIGWMVNDRFYSQIHKDAEWPHPERSLNSENDAIREQLTQHTLSQLGDRTDLIEKLIPTYPPFSKRLLVDHGWVPALIKPNVTVVNEGIAELREDRVVTTSGREITADAVLFATGYDVQRFLSTLNVVGRSGTTLRELWGDDDGAAFLGAAVPDFPNFFCIYGPNTQTGHGGSLIALVEHQMNFIASAIEQMVDKDIGVLEIKQEVLDSFIETIDDMHEKLVWTHPGVDNYYRNSKGRVIITTPFSTFEFWNKTKAADLGLFHCEERKRPLEEDSSRAIVEQS